MKSMETPAAAGNTGKVRGAGADRVDSSTKGHLTTEGNRALPSRGSTTGANAYIDGIRVWDRNKELFERKIVLPAIEDAKSKRPILMQQLVEEIRRKDYVDSDGQPVKLNNNHVAVFARILWTEHPEVRPYLHLRKSVWDDMFGIRIGVDGKPRKVDED